MSMAATTSLACLRLTISDGAAMKEACGPVHLLRRFFADPKDVGIAWLLVASFMAFFLDDSATGRLDAPKHTNLFGFGVQSGSFKPPVCIISATCGKPVSLLPALRNYVALAKLIAAEACFDLRNGSPAGGSVTVTLADTPEAWDLAATEVTIP